MGRYLGIGIVTEVSTNKTEAIKALSGEDAAKDYLNRRYNPTGLYDFTDNGSYNFTLKRDIVRREWIDDVEGLLSNALSGVERRYKHYWKSSST